jgi:hypothetical protein
MKCGECYNFFYYSCQRCDDIDAGKTRGECEINLVTTFLGDECILTDKEKQEAEKNGFTFETKPQNRG